MTPDALRAVLDKRPGTENMAAPGPDAELRARVAVNLIGPALAVVEAAREAVDIWKRPVLGVTTQRGAAIATDAAVTEGMVRIYAALAAFDAALERE